MKSPMKLMHKFPHPLQAGDDAGTGKPVFGFNLNGMFITDPSLSECGRFSVNPLEAYGLSAKDVAELERLNKALESATMAAKGDARHSLESRLATPGQDPNN